MAVTIERLPAAEATPIGAFRERRLRRGVTGDRTRTLDIGLVNNMPDAALLATERQFAELLASAAGDFAVRLHLYALGDVPRSAEGRSALAQGYSDARQLGATRLDALIVTGAEPVAADIAEEPYWRALTELIDWADANTFSTILSCLAAHAGALHLGGAARRTLQAKCSGIYAFETVARHRLLAGLEAGMTTPHSRRNGLDREDLARRGYQTLTCHAEIGVDIFVKQKRSLFVFMQGHPEYGRESLGREYRRDMGRFLQGERDAPPPIPVNYFPAEIERSLAAFGARAISERRPQLMSEFPEAAVFGAGETPWRKTAAQLYGNWLAIIAERKAALREPAPIAAIRRGG